MTTNEVEFLFIYSFLLLIVPSHLLLMNPLVVYLSKSMCRNPLCIRNIAPLTSRWYKYYAILSFTLLFIFYHFYAELKKLIICFIYIFIEI